MVYVWLRWVLRLTELLVHDGYFSCVDFLKVCRLTWTPSYSKYDFRLCTQIQFGVVVSFNLSNFKYFFSLGFDTGVGRIQLARRHRADAKRCKALAVLADKGQ